MANPQKLGNFVNALFQDASNNIGIGGSPSGSYKLEVTGTAKVSSTLLLGGALTGTSATFSSGGTSNAGFFTINDGTTTLGNSFAVVHRNANDGNGRFSLTRWQVQNTSGLEQSAFIGAQAVTGASNYSPNLILGVSTGVSTYSTYLTIVSTGAATFSSSVTASSSTTGTQVMANFAAANYGSPSSRTYIQIGTQYGDGSSRIGSINTTGNQSALVFQSHSATADVWNDAMYINGTGNVGIGATPLEKLWVNLATNVNFAIGGTTRTRILGVVNANDNFCDISLEGQIVSFYSAGAERMRITSGGEIQSSGDLKFNSANTVYNASGDFYVRASTHLRLGAGGTNSLMTVFNNGNVSINTSDIGYKLNLNGQPGANGYTAWTNYSDSRLKENVTDFDATNVLDKINRIRPVTYNYNELSGFDEATRERRISGFIAQELMEVFPDMVGTIKKEDTEYYDTNLSNLNLYLVKAIQELNERLNKAGL